MTFPPITRRVRHFQRYAQVLEVLARHGFADLSQQLGLDSLLDRARTAIGTAPSGTNERIPVAVRLRTMLVELGPTYVKLGQVMSTRPDLVPQDWVDEFKKLQNKVPGVDYGVIEKMLEEEFPGRRKRLFRSFQHQPVAAGSMAQIHRARLRDGTRIVLKFLRPGIREVIAVDMEILQALAELVEAHFANLGYSPTEIVREFAKELQRETDMMQEGRSTERLRSLFADDLEVMFPAVYWEATTHNVLAIEEIDGLVLADLGSDRLSPDDRRTLVKNGARAVFRQCLEFGFFHADPHPGNLMALPNGRIAFIDCGMTGEIDVRTSRQLADLVSGVVAGDLDRVIAAAGAITEMDYEKMEDRALRADVNAIVSAFRGTPLERLNLGKVLQDFFASLRTHRVRCPADIILLIKALTTIESIAHELDPSFELVPFVRPYLEDLVAKRYGMPAMKNRMQRGLRQYIELLEDLPGELRPILSQLRRNKLAVNLEHRGLDRVTRTIEHASRNISFAVIIAAMFVGSSILVHAARMSGATALTAVGYVGFVAAAILVVVMLVSNRRNRGD
ncbi:MAG: AarF/ABC1/UbiB kinase family protein [Planctomycetia bacterium]|nr:AarF/ABC1/UbiB kinase family protein [Planctomycetia bacterium]